jgi:alkanesulfonate monooxygenase SsuD/methylene tetrahydromethanopterin reductase-like flavin-dependent oxidoreductase (luciferase family)
MRFGVVILPELPWVAARDVWRRAEELGFEHAWTYDHIAWGSLRDSAWYASIPTLTAAAVVTERVRLGTLVASPNFRHPVPFARELLALDEISGGRLTLGFGAGGSGWDATILGQEPWTDRERGERFAEFVELLDRLLSTPPVTHRGRYYSAVDAPMVPGCVQEPRVPFAIAATGSKGMRLAAAYAETWVSNGSRTHEGPPLDAVAGCRLVAEQMARLETACRDVGRDPMTLRRLVLAGLRLDGGLSSVDAFLDTVGRYEEIGVTEFVVYWPRASEPYKSDPATFEAIAATFGQSPRPAS